MISSQSLIRTGSRSFNSVKSSVLIALYSGALLGISAVGFLSIISGLVDLSDSGEDTATFLIYGTALTITCAYLFRYISNKKLNRPETFLAVTSGFVCSILFSAFLYLFLSEENSFANAVFESVSAFTTTALTTLNLETSGNGLIFFRTVSQLLGALNAVLFAVMVVPISDNTTGSTKSRRLESQDSFTDRKTAIKNIAGMYLVSIVLLSLMLLLTELDFFTSLILSISAITSGGFSTNTEHFESLSVQLLLSVGMIISGMSVVVIWKLTTGKIKSVFRSTELHIYLSIVIVASFLLFAWTDEGGTPSLSKSIFLALASITTTGFHISPFSNWPVAAAFLLLLLATVGGMSFSSTGGFHIYRLRILAAVSFRELIRQIHPRAVVKIKIGEENIKEERIREVVVFQFLFTSIIFLTAIALTVSGMSIYEGLSSSISVITTTGPIRNTDGVILEISSFSSLEKMALLPAMISGRLYLLPLVISVGYLFSELKNILRPKKRLFHLLRNKNDDKK